MTANRPCSRRDLLRLSLASGVALATGLPAPANASGPVVRAEERPGFARKRFLESMNCAQALMEAWAPALGVSVDDARRIAAGFARGMGMGAQCGAVTGAFMVIGMKYGKSRDDDSAADSETFRRMELFAEAFRERHRHLDCSSLLETDMSNKGGILLAKLKGRYTERCPDFVESAAEILEEII